MNTNLTTIQIIALEAILLGTARTAAEIRTEVQNVTGTTKTCIRPAIAGLVNAGLVFKSVEKRYTVVRAALRSGEVYTILAASRTVNTPHVPAVYA